MNVASKCGLTPQYEGLVRLNGQYRDRGFTVLGVPCNQFMGQEPGSAEEILYAEHGSHIHMDGKEVFRRAVRIMVDSATKSMRHAGVTADDVALVVPHQANVRIIQATGKKLGLPSERVVVTVDRHGNTSAASIPLALDAACRDGRIKRGDLVMIEAIGGGFTWGSALIRW